MTLQEMVDESRRIVFFGGAGVSTESGIPDFRSVDGLYHQQYDTPPETILSHSFFLTHPEEFYRFYRAKMLPLDAQPNAAHLKLAELEQAGRLSAVITQNIDGLHQKGRQPDSAGAAWEHLAQPLYALRKVLSSPGDRGGYPPGSPVYLRRMDQARRGPLRGRTGGGRACRGRGLPSPGGHADRGRNQPDGIPRRWPGAVFPGEKPGAHQPGRHAHGFPGRGW